MKACHPKNLVLALLSSLLLISCSNSSGPTLAGGGIDGTGIISVGSITAFGSIVVNGTEFDTSDAAIIVEGEEIGIGDLFLDNLDIGMVVTIEGKASEDGNSVIADRVIYNDNVEGPVESIPYADATTKEIVVLGQTVIVNVITKFKGTTFDTLVPDDVVEVSGYFDDTGVIWATFLEKTGEFTPNLVVEVKGFVANLDANAKTFEINDLAVDYSLADTSGLPEGEPTEGLFVEVEGTFDPATGEMLATEIELADEIGVEDANKIEITGFVTDFISVFEFTVGNQVVQTDPDTVFIDGAADDIASGVKLEAEGSLVDGILFAEEIEFWGPDQIEVEGIVTEVNFDIDLVEFTIRNQAGEQVVQADTNTTIFEGVQPDGIEVGMKLEVKGVPNDIDHSVLVADKVSFEED